MASSPQPPVAASSPVVLHHEIPAPPGWQRKVFPRKGKGQTPKKSDVIYVAPDGEEIKSKAHLQRYLKGHPGGPAVSEFNWSSGETPTRRSERLFTKMPPENLETEVTPKRTKRNAAQIYEEQKDDKKISSPPSKRATKDGKGMLLEGTDRDGTHVGASVTGKEMVQDVVWDECKQSDDEVVGQTIEGGVEIHEELKERAVGEQEPVENTVDKFVIVDNEKSVEQEVEKIEDKSELMHGSISAISQVIGVPEATLGQATEDLDGNTDNVLHSAAEEAGRGEQFETLPVNSIDTVLESKVAPEMQEASEQEQQVDGIPAVGLLRRKGQGEAVVEDNPGCIGSSTFMEVDPQGHEKGSSRDVFCSPEPVGVTN
eukprot:c24408_g1_i1 orf=371-1483(-)